MLIFVIFFTIFAPSYFILTLLVFPYPSKLLFKFFMTLYYDSL